MEFANQKIPGNALYRQTMQLLRTHRWMLLQALGVLTLLTTALILAIASTAARRAGDPQLSAILAAIALVFAACAGWGSIPRLLRATNFNRFFPSFSFYITRSGLVYILFVFIVALAAMNSGNNLLFLLLAIFLAIILASGVFSRMNLGGIQISVHTPEIPYAGTEVYLRAALKNEKMIWPSYGILVEGYRKSRRWRAHEVQRGFRPLKIRFRIPAKWERNMFTEAAVYVPSLSPGKSVSVGMKVRFLRRGKYIPGRFYLATRFPLGFFYKGIGMICEKEFLIYPSISGEERLRAITLKAEGLRESMHRGWDGQFYSHRAYTSADGVRYVDWKASAKVGELLLRENTREEQLRIHLIMDGQISTGNQAEKDQVFEQMISDAAGITKWFVDQGAAVGLTYNRNCQSPTIGEEAYHSLMEILALAERPEDKDDQRDSSWEVVREALCTASSESELILFTARSDMSYQELPFHWRLEYPLPA